ncbi:hypothetical protein BYT27DRAFT_7138009 [Phlegmacium glaucopus]|nr:hypothetical protein BYT27DRAFT_7138009 [Phlegmacium glaucopus]
MPSEEKQCRICLDGPESEPELGRLIRPCLCKGSISYVHLKCLHRWRSISASKSAFFACPQCHYQYRFARTRIVGIGTNPVLVGGLSGLLFTLLVMIASYITTFFMSSFEEPTYYHPFYVNPLDVVHDLVTAAFRVMKDGNLAGILEDNIQRPVAPSVPRPPRGIITRFIQRFIIGLPLVGAGSLVHMILSVQILAPMQWLAQYRGSRNRRNSGSQDIAALIVITLLIVGALRALYKVYQFTQSITRRVLLRAEDAILEVN